MNSRLIYILFISISLTSLSGKSYTNGIDIFFSSDLSKYETLRIAVVANHTSLDKDGNSLVDLANEHLNLKAIFTPEHGLFGKDEAGKKINDNAFNGIPVYSLYGKNKKPTSDQLKNIDLILFDMQDIGSRYYTYISTMTYVMQAALDNEVKIIVLDRPNPIGRAIEGPILRNGFQSFVGMHPIPIRHGLTIGELALMIEGMNWISGDGDLDLEVIKVLGWNGEPVSIDIPPSPNIPDLETAIIYSGLCLLEGTNISEGRGTDTPFKILGAPWLNSEDVLDRIKSSGVRGADVSGITFIPKSIPGKAAYPKYKSEECKGIKIDITDFDSFYPLKLGVLILKSIHDSDPENFKILETNFIDKLYGSDQLKENIINGLSINELVLTWKYESEQFRKVSQPYRIYK